jgi:uncharacterized protein YcbK (DUF882 family)
MTAQRDLKFSRRHFFKLGGGLVGAGVVGAIAKESLFGPLPTREFTFPVAPQQWVFTLAPEDLQLAYTRAPEDWEQAVLDAPDAEAALDLALNEQPSFDFPDGEDLTLDSVDYLRTAPRLPTTRELPTVADLPSTYELPGLAELSPLQGGHVRRILKEIAEIPARIESMEVADAPPPPDLRPEFAPQPAAEPAVAPVPESALAAKPELRPELAEPPPAEPKTKAAEPKTTVAKSVRKSPQVQVREAKKLSGDGRMVAALNTHTGERLKATYWEHGHYLPDALQEVNRLFRDHRTNDITKIDPKLIDLLYRLSQKVEARREYHIISAYRSPKTNAMLRQKSKAVAKNSYHTKGQAVDIRLPERRLAELHRAALALKGGGVGIYRKSGFIHVDTGRVRSWG